MDSPEEKEEICDICGNIGVDNAIITCTLCKKNCEHMYCMRVRLEKATDDWICEDCEFVLEPVPPACSMPIEVSKLNCVEEHKSGAESKKLQNESRVGLSSGNWEKRVERGKTKYLSVNEAIMLSSGGKNSCAPVRFNWQSKSRVRKVGTNVFERTAIRSKTVPISSQQDLASGSSQQPKLHRPGNMDIWRKQVQHSTKLTEEPRQVSSPQPSQVSKNRDIQKELQRETQWAQTKARRHANKQPSILLLSAPPVTISGGNTDTSNELRVSETENINTIVSPDLEKRSRAPALDALWKGSFRINDDNREEELNPQIQAYPPSRVLKKIYEFSKKMPEELQFQLVCAKTFWTNLFIEDIIPDERDIALYFFPTKRGRSEDYICLLETISLRDLALRVQIGDVELLVFTSKLLPDGCQCLNGKYFLWGVFHRLKKDTTSCTDKRAVELPVPAGDQVDERKEVDMDIDMIGGTEVGRIDIPVKKARNAHLVNLKKEDLHELIPPGFEDTSKRKMQSSSSMLQ